MSLLQAKSISGDGAIVRTRIEFPFRVPGLPQLLVFWFSKLLHSFLLLLFSTMLRSSLLNTVRRTGRRMYHPSVLPSPVSRSSPEFQEKARNMDALVEDIESKLAAARQGGGPKAAARMKSKGKLLPRERYGRLHAATAYMQCRAYLCTNRLAFLLDSHSPFLELSALAAHEVYPEPIPGAGMITGIGRIAGRECVIVVNDATVKGGSYHPLTVKKHLRAQEIARENNLPCVYVGEVISMLARPQSHGCAVESGGAALPHQANVRSFLVQESVTADFCAGISGQGTFRSHILQYGDASNEFLEPNHTLTHGQAQMSSLNIPQIAIVHGISVAGGAYVPAMADENIIVQNQGRIFLAGPPLVKAATGEVVDEEHLGGGEMHSKESGVTDHLARDDEHAIAIARGIIGDLGTAWGGGVEVPVSPSEPNLFVCKV